jgi:hypothetical protein
VGYAKLLEMNSFLLGISFYKLAKHKICQVKFGANSWSYSTYFHMSLRTISKLSFPNHARIPFSTNDHNDHQRTTSLHIESHTMSASQGRMPGVQYVQVPLSHPSATASVRWMPSQTRWIQYKHRSSEKATGHGQGSSFPCMPACRAPATPRTNSEPEANPRMSLLQRKKFNWHLPTISRTFLFFFRKKQYTMHALH